MLLPETDNCPWISGSKKMTVDQSPWKNVADLGGRRTHDLLVSSRTCIQLSHWGCLDYYLFFLKHVNYLHFCKCSNWSNRKGVFSTTPYFSRKTYAVGTHLKCLAEVLLMSTHNMFLWKNKKKISVLFNPSLAEHDIPCLSKQCRSRSVGF